MGLTPASQGALGRLPRGEIFHFVPPIPQTSLPVVGVEVSGRCVVTIEELRKKLGRGGFRVWEALITRRDRDGFTHVTRKGLANAEGYARLSDKTVARALARLRDAGLVSDSGWQRLRVPVGYEGETAVRKVWVRRVYGARIIRGKNDETRALVPTETMRWLAKAKGHGGARRGAGRKRVFPADRLDLINALRRKLAEAHRNWSKGKRVHATHGIDWLAVCEHLGACPGESRRAWHIDHIRPLASFDWHDPNTPRLAFAPENHQWLTAQENLRKSDRIDHLFATLPEHEFRRALDAEYGETLSGERRRLRVIPGGRDVLTSTGSSGGDPSVSCRDQGVPVRAQNAESRHDQEGAPRDLGVGGGSREGVTLLSSQAQREPPPPAGAFFARVGGMRFNGEETEHGVLLGTPRQRPQIFGNAIPRYPCSGTVPMARVPSPPLLDAGLGPRRRRSTLARWFKTALISRFGKKAKGAGAGFARSKKIENLLDAAAERFIEYEIAPAAWCAWSCDVSLRLFQKDPEHPKPPTIFWVYSAKWIEERREWFEHEADTIGGRMIATRAHNELTRRWYAMDRELRLARATTEEAQREIVAKHFPGDLYRELVEQAHVQVVDIQNSINSLARSGDKWLW